MSLDYFENSLQSGMIQAPNDYYRELQQSFIDEQWDNTSAKRAIYQQKLDYQGNFTDECFEKIEAWTNSVVGQGTSMRNGHDFVQLAFRDIDYYTIQGRYYQFDNNYWITTFDDEHDSISKTIVVRRCNNYMKIVDPENGAIFSIPCAIEYDMSSPSSQVSRYIVTPNNHATVIVQGNKDTERLFKINTRYLFGGRPFKLYSYQNTILSNLEMDEATLVYLDLYLDEIHDKDDLVNGIADNGEYNYQVQINAQSMTLANGSTGKLSADVLLNNVEVDKKVLWVSSNEKVVKIDNDGNYAVIGQEGESAEIYAYLEGNEQAQDMISIIVADATSTVPEIYLDPAFDKIREYQVIDFNVHTSYLGKDYVPTEVKISLDGNKIVTSNENLVIKQTTTGWQIQCLKRNQTELYMWVDVSNTLPSFKQKTKFAIKAISMMG
jgi:hypothetical protein